MVLEAQLKERNRLVLGKALAVDSEDRWWIARLDCLAEVLDIGGTFDERVAFGWLFEVSLGLRPYLRGRMLLIG